MHVLLLNLVLDTLVAAYTKYSEEQEEAVTEEKVQGILNVFQTVSRVTGSSVITRQTFMDFCEARFARSGAVGVVGVVLQNCWDTLQKFLEDRWSWKCNRPQKILSRWLWVNNEPYYPRKYAKEQGCICSVLGNARQKKICKEWELKKGYGVVYLTGAWTNKELIWFFMMHFMVCRSLADHLESDRSTRKRQISCSPLWKLRAALSTKKTFQHFCVQHRGCLIVSLFSSHGLE